MHTKRLLLHGQWVDVTVLPPQPAPAGLDAQPVGRRGLGAYDETVYAEPRRRRRRGNSPS